MFHTKVVEEIRTYILYPKTIFLKNEPFYEIRWKNTVGRDRLQIDSMAHAHCMLGD